MPIAPSAPLIGAPIAMPARTPLIRIPRSAPPKPDARRDIHAHLRPGSTPSVRTTPPCLSLSRGQSKSDAERQDESGDQCFHAQHNARRPRIVPRSSVFYAHVMRFIFCRSKAICTRSSDSSSASTAPATKIRMPTPADDPRQAWCARITMFTATERAAAGIRSRGRRWVAVKREGDETARACSARKRSASLAILFRSVGPGFDSRRAHQP
jgi:hypothetical protein